MYLKDQFWSDLFWIIFSPNIPPPETWSQIVSFMKWNRSVLFSTVIHAHRLISGSNINNKICMECCYLQSNFICPFLLTVLDVILDVSKMQKCKSFEKCFPLQFPHFRNPNESEKIKYRAILAECSLRYMTASLINRYCCRTVKSYNFPAYSKEYGILHLVSSKVNADRDLSTWKCSLMPPGKVEFMMKTTRSSLTPSRKLTAPRISSLASSTMDLCKF